MATSKNPLLDYLNSPQFERDAKPGYADGGSVQTTEGPVDVNGNPVDTGGNTDTNTGTNTGSTTQTPAVFYDNFGNEYSTQEAADAANNAVNTAIQNGNLPPGAPAGTKGVSSDGKSWVDAAGKILGTIITSVVTPWLNNLQSGGQLQAGQNMAIKAGSAFDASNLQLQDLNSLIPQLKQQVQQGTMTAAQAQAILQQDSNMQNVQTDAGSLAAQRAGLAQLSDIANHGGMTDADRAQLTETMNQTNANAAGQRNAALQQLQMQGNAGTGAELATRLAGAQGTANNNALAGANVATSAQARALQALNESVTGNAALNSTQFQQQADKARAQDAVNQFNASAQNQIAMGNQTAQQQANMANFNMANQIAGKNTDISNQNALLPLQTANQMNTTRLNTATGLSNANNTAAQTLFGQGNKQATNSAGAAAGANTPTTPGSSAANAAGSAVGNAAGTYIANNAGSWLSDLFSDEKLKEKKKEMTDQDIEDMLGELTGYKFRYKGNNNPMTSGVMAQDMEKSKLGSSSVVNTPNGKMLSGNETMGKALAALANMHGRLKNLEGK